MTGVFVNHVLYSSSCMKWETVGQFFFYFEHTLPFSCSFVPFFPTLNPIFPFPFWCAIKPLALSTAIGHILSLGWSYAKHPERNISTVFFRRHKTCQGLKTGKTRTTMLVDIQQLMHQTKQSFGYRTVGIWIETKWESKLVTTFFLLRVTLSYNVNRMGKLFHNRGDTNKLGIVWAVPIALGPIFLVTRL